MGTPDFSVQALASLHKNGFHIPLVVTQPDRPKGRGRKMIPTPVKKAALELGCRVVQPESVKSDEFLDFLKGFSPDLFVVAAYGKILPEKLLKMPPYGAINIHASLLPKYRGAAPIHRAIINGEKASGITTMQMDKGLDTGDMLLKAETGITGDDTAETLHDRLAAMGGELIVKTLNGIVNNTIVPIAQDDDLSTYAAMLTKEEGHIDWALPAKQLDCLIRGMTPWPGAFTFAGDKRLKIYLAKPVDRPDTDQPGVVIQADRGKLVVGTGSGALSILEIQGASGKRLEIEAFLRGFQIPPGTLLT